MLSTDRLPQHGNATTRPRVRKVRSRATLRTSGKGSRKVRLRLDVPEDVLCRLKAFGVDIKRLLQEVVADIAQQDIPRRRRKRSPSTKRRFFERSLYR